MSMECPEHGWGIGELGCEPCDKKNSNPYGRMTGQLVRASEAANRLNTVLMSHNYHYPVIDPKASVILSGSVA